MEAKFEQFIASIKDQFEVDEESIAVFKEAFMVVYGSADQAPATKKAVKRAPNAFQVFYAEKKKALAQMKGPERHQMIKEEWAKLTPEQKSAFKPQAAVAAAEPVEAEVPKTKGKGKGKGKAEKAEKKDAVPADRKPINAYNIFMKHTIKDESIPKDQRSLKNIGAMWRAMTEEQKAPWKAQVTQVNAERKGLIFV